MAKAKFRPPKIRMNADNKLLLRQSGDNYMNSAMALAISRDAERDKGKAWTKRIKPSAWTFDICIEDYQNTCDQVVAYGLKTRLKFLYGNAFHKYIGSYLVEHYPDIYATPNLPESSQSWYKKVYPEVPISSEKWMTKAIIDFPVKLKQSTWVVDWKTTWEDEEGWNKFLQNPRIDPKYIFQGASYCFLSREENLFDTPPDHFGLVYINMKEEPEDRNMWREQYYEYAPYAKPIELLWNLLKEATVAKIKGGFVSCANPYCATHGSLDWRKIPETKDPWKPSTPSNEATKYELFRTNEFLVRARGSVEEVRAAQSFSRLDWEESLGEDYCGQDFSL